MRRLFASLALLIAASASAQQPDVSQFREMHWRMIGPFRGGRVKAAVGVPSQPNVFYFGAVNGGVWKSTDYGRTWNPIFDDQPTGSIGAIAVAPSDPNIIYVGSGEGLQRPDLSTGDGIYKSTDAGKTWTHLGLRDGQQIPQIIVDPKNPNRLFVAVLGHPYGPNTERGIYRSTDGGATFTKVLGKDENTGGIDVIFDPSNPQTVFAALWEQRQAPWENGVWSGSGSGLFKSTDGGDTWRPLTAGLPTFAHDTIGRIGIAVAPSDPRRMYATVDMPNTTGFYRSDDAGESWTQPTKDEHIVERGSDMAEIKVDPTNPDIVYTASVVSWKSVDGGKTWLAFRGAPGGDDYQRIWINPTNSNVIMIGSDQGVIITVNGGETWSSWYNQPTAQFYHVSADNAFPYRVCGGQQESGSACVSSRGDDGRITFREWHPVGAEEYAYVAADPLNPDIVYGGSGNHASRYDRRTLQASDITPTVERGKLRGLRTAPILFSPLDPHTLYFAQSVLWKTTTQGQSWTQISPDLTRKTWDIPASIGKYRDAVQVKQRGVIYTVAPSPVARGVIWAGTDDGLIHVTRDGGTTWHDVTPPALTAWQKVSLIDAGHHDAQTAYAAINTLRLDDLTPHIYRTHDGGKSWTQIVNGIPAGETVNAVREDPVRTGLLFAATERAIYVSFDDGDHWQSLRLNMPVTSMRDVVIKDNDLIVGTHGRGFWILDDISPLRQVDASTASTVHLYTPAAAWRYRWDKNTDTPLPPDEPAGENPPDGAIIDYSLPANAASPVTLEILDASGQLVRRYASTDTAPPIRDEGNIPRWWIRPVQILSPAAGTHRFVWDLHYAPPAGVTHFSFPISATPGNTWREPRGPWVMPGTYTVRLTVDGKRYSMPLVVRMDPRVTTPIADLRAAHAIAMTMYNGIAHAYAGEKASRSARGPTRDAPDPDDPPVELKGSTEPTFASVREQMLRVLDLVEGSDTAPTAAAIKAAHDATDALARVEARQRTR